MVLNRYSRREDGTLDRNHQCTHHTCCLQCTHHTCCLQCTHHPCYLQCTHHPCCLRQNLAGSVLGSDRILALGPHVSANHETQTGSVEGWDRVLAGPVLGSDRILA